MTSRRWWEPPLLLQAPPDPPELRPGAGASVPLRIDATTTPARLTARAMLGARRYSVPASILSITHQIGEALVPVLMGIAIERAVATGDPAQLVLWLGLLAADFALLSFSWRFGSRFGELAVLTVQHRLRALAAERLLLRPAPHPASGARTDRADDRRSDASFEQPGVALSLATSDVNRLADAVEILVYPLGQFAAIVFGGAVLLTISWPLGLAVLLGAPLLLWITDRAGRALRRRSEEEQDAAATASGSAADLMAGYRVIRGLGDGAETEAARRYHRASRTALAGTLRARRAEGVFGGTMAVVTGLFVTAIAVAAGLSALAGTIGLGELIMLVGLTQFLLDPLQYFARTTGALWASATASAARLLPLLRDPAAPVTRMAPAAPGASFPPAAASTPVPSTEPAAPTAPVPPAAPTAPVPPAAPVPPTASTPVPSGEPAAVTASAPPATTSERDSGTGSSAADVVVATGGVGPMAPGEIVGLAVDDVAAAHLLAALAAEHPRALLAPHAAHLFAGTVRENVALPGVAADRAEAALVAAGCDEFAELLPQGLDAPVGEAGSALSGGQRQRVALARALAAEAPLLLLHDPTTAVDAVTEAAIAARLRPLRTAHRTLLLTRSPALLAIADRVLHPTLPAPAATTETAILRDEEDGR